MLWLQDALNSFWIFQELRQSRQLDGIHMGKGNKRGDIVITWRSSGCAVDLAIWIFHFANMDWAIIFQEPCIWFFQDPRVQKHNLMGFILMAMEWDSWSVSWARCRAFLGAEPSVLESL